MGASDRPSRLPPCFKRFLKGPGGTVIPSRTQPAGLPWAVRLAAWKFAYERSDYFEYLASCLQGPARHRTLLDLFQADAIRHGTHSNRGVLANWWASRYLASGADLGETFEGTLPLEDVVCIRITQVAGQQALGQMLQSMSIRTAVLCQCRSTYIQTVLAGVFAVITALVVLTILPMFTVPELMMTFSSVSVDQIGPNMKALMAWQTFLQSYGWLIPIASLLVTMLVGWSVQNWVGPLRDSADRFGVWRLVRDLHAIRFLSLTAALIRNLGSRGLSLRAIVEMQLETARPWLAHHLLRMLKMMDLGVEPIEALNSGIVDADCWARLHDVVLGYGLTHGFVQAGERVQTMLVARLRRQSVVLRWLMLIASLVVVMGMAVWHLRAIEEMRQAMLLGLSGF